MKKQTIEIDNSGNAYISIPQAAVIIGDSKEMFTRPDAYPQPIPAKVNDTQKEPQMYDMVPWGQNNIFPNEILAKIAKSHDISSNLLFNIQVAYGDGIMPVKKTWNDAKKDFDYTPILNNPDINEFFENNDMSVYLLEQLNDIYYFYNSFPEIILSRDPDSSKRKVVSLQSKEAVFSRWVKKNSEGVIDTHLYGSRWFEPQPGDMDVIATSVLHPKWTLMDLKQKMGLMPRIDGKTIDDKCFRYIVPVTIPVPGRQYYHKPQWYSLIESGWYDFAMAIPEFKKAILKNQMTIKYIIYINERYFPAIFAEEGIVDDDKKKARMKKEYDDIGKFLSGTKNSGKGTFSKFKYNHDGKEEYMIKIEPIVNHFKGGEYIEDSEEASNILAYGMGVHGALIGSHGKAGNINGTESRELFTIKQALAKPVRDRVLKPLYVVKAINKWPSDTDFIIRNTQLTTLDKGTGAVKSTGSPVN